MSLDTHEQVNAWLREQATEAAGVMIMCAPADIAGGDPWAKGAFESVATDAIGRWPPRRPSKGPNRLAKALTDPAARAA